MTKGADIKYKNKELEILVGFNLVHKIKIKFENRRLNLDRSPKTRGRRLKSTHKTANYFATTMAATITITHHIKL